MLRKICSKCFVEKDVSEFRFRNDRKKYRNECNLCLNKLCVSRYQSNPENKKQKVMMWRKNNPEKYSEINKKWREKNLKNYRKKRKECDFLFGLIHRVRSRIRSFMLQKNITKNNTTFDIVGCAPHQLKEHLESKFTEGMEWKKMGREIHIDHIIPLSSAKNEEEIYKLCHYTNLQPLWATDNRKKSNKLVE